MTTISDRRANANWPIDQLALYQAANNSREAVKRNFVVRTAEFDLIISDLRSKKYNDPLQHELIQGRRGSGKSTLLRRIQVEIDEDFELAEKYIAINLAEEQAAIYRLSDLWFEVLQELFARLGDKKPLQDFSTFESNQDYTRYLYSEIHQLLLAAKKRVVLLLDNLDRILENFDQDAHLLREFLLNYNDIQIIGAGDRMDGHFRQYDKPFYEFFRRHQLEGLSFEEIHLLLNHWSKIMRLPVLRDYALRHRGRIEALRILTGGLPRSVQFFIEILLHNSSLTGFDYLSKIMDFTTPHYQEKLNSLTPPQRKIALELAFWWEACPTKILVEKCRMEGKLIASYLKQLAHYGVVEILRTDSKNHLYRLSDRFFNMWLIITQGNADQKRLVRQLVLFLEAFYDEKEWHLIKTHPYNGQSQGNALLESIAIQEIRDGYFDQLTEKVEQIVRNGQSKDLSRFLTKLLYYEQKQLVLSLFESEKYGADLKNKYRLTYYATLLIAHKTADNLLLKIPPEIMPTIHQLAADIRERQGDVVGCRL